MSIESAAVHAGKKGNKKDPYGAHVSPIYQTSTFYFDDVESGAKAFAHEPGGASHIYSRLGNPNVEELESAITALETYGMGNAGDYSCLVFGSGMAAITTGIISLANQRHIIAQDALYGCTSQFLEKEVGKLGMSASFIDTSNLETVKLELEKHPNAGLVYLESIANPTMSISDIQSIAEVAAHHGALVMVDNTFATPYHIQPFKLGADVVVHSTTKYFGGHGTIIGGALLAKKEVFEKYETAVYRKNLGGIAGPMSAWLTTIGIKTLPLRMQKHAENGIKVARYLENHPEVAQVYYPGLPSHAHHQLAKKIMQNGFGGMIALELKGGYDAGVALMNKVQLCTLAVSLGSVDSLIQHPASMTHSVVGEAIREKAGITDGLVRLSVGIESADDIIADLEQALK